MPEDRSRYVNDEEAMLLSASLQQSMSLLHLRLLPRFRRSLASIYAVDNLHNKIRTYIDDACERLMVNREAADEPEYIDELLCYLLIHRTYMAHHKPDLWGLSEGW